MSLEAKRISILKTELDGGCYPLIISDVKLYKRNGVIVTNDENPGVIITYKHEDKIHQELYWIGGNNYTKFQKLMIAIELDPALQHDKKEVIGKAIWGLIQETKYMRGTEEIRSEKRLSEVSDFTKNKPTGEPIIYTPETFNPEDAAF